MRAKGGVFLTMTSDENSSWNLLLGIIVASEARDLLSDAVHFHCLGTHTQVPSFDMYLIPEKSGGEGMGGEQVFCRLSPPRRLGISKN